MKVEIKIVIPNGYRKLKANAITREGDLYFDDSFNENTWEPVNAPGYSANDGYYIRKVLKEPTK